MQTNVLKHNIAGNLLQLNEPRAMKYYSEMIVQGLCMTECFGRYLCFKLFLCLSPSILDWFISNVYGKHSLIVVSMHSTVLFITTEIK